MGNKEKVKKLDILSSLCYTIFVELRDYPQTEIEMNIDSMIDESRIDDMMENELIGFISTDMSDEEVLAFIDELEAEEDAREELFDHFAN